MGTQGLVEWRKIMTYHWPLNFQVLSLGIIFPHMTRCDIVGKSRRQVKMLKQDFDDDKET